MGYRLARISPARCGVASSELPTVPGFSILPFRRAYSDAAF
jgi:hypothetical protein